MRRETRMMLRLCKPALLVACVGSAAFAAGWQASTQPLLEPLAPILFNAGLAGMVATGVCLMWALWRYAQWRRGRGLVCDCTGLLGAEVSGRYGPYRRCLACGDAVSQRRYG